MATSSSQKNFQRSNTAVDSCKGLDACWPDVSMDTLLLPPTTNPYTQQVMLSDFGFGLGDLPTEHQDFSYWPPPFGNYAVDGYYPMSSMSYSTPATPTPTSTMEPFLSLAYATQCMSADTNCMPCSDLSHNNVSSHNFNFNKSDDTNDSDSDSDANAFTLAPNSPILEIMDTKPKLKSKSKSKSKPRMRKLKESKPLKNFVCNIDGCEKVFSRQFNLDQHSKTHSNERPFVCERESCKKAFIRRADLVRHGRTHTGETPFKCKFPDCDEMFSRTEARQRHYAKAHQELHQKSP